MPEQITLAEMTYQLPEDLAARVRAELSDWRAHDKARRLWARDATLWTGKDEDKWLGWLGAVDGSLVDTAALKRLAEEVRGAGFTHALLLGMGGSSLFPEVLATTFGQTDGSPALHVLDSTDPAQVRAAEGKIDLARTLFIVSSKSGGTLEPEIFREYFFERARQVVGGKEAGRRFIAITDPGSKLEQVAERDGFRYVFQGLPSIGGRYSALSNFGMVPAAIMGLDVPDLVARAAAMARRCGAEVAPEENPGVVLGTILGVMAQRGRGKVTIVTSPGIWDFGAWLEQLLAESTGKEGKALIPVDLERPAPPEVYGSDRVFIYIRLEERPDAAQDAAIAAIEAAGQPVARIAMPSPSYLAGEVFRWEFATAVAGSIMKINPFNQPDVEASKIATQKLTSAYEESGALPPETPILGGDDLKLYTDAGNALALAATASDNGSTVALLRAHLDRLRPGDYCAILAYVEMNPAHVDALQTLRHAIRDRKRVATCLGFGPRFLHSTGQAYKGGPNTGVFLQITADDAADLPVPGRRYTFGVVKAAQARGDFAVLAERGRRALRVHLGPDVDAGLALLHQFVSRALE